MPNTPDNREAIARIKEREELIDIVARFMPINEPTSSTFNLVNAILATRGDRFAEGVEAAAKVAEEWRVQADANLTAQHRPAHYAGVRAASISIAAAIRSLKAPEAGG